MFTIKCKCGKSTKNFKFDIGPFCTLECCEEAEKAPKQVIKEEAPKKVEFKKESRKAKKKATKKK